MNGIDFNTDYIVAKVKEHDDIVKEHTEEINALKTRDAVVTARFDTLCMKLDKLTDRLESQTSAMNKTHEDFMVLRAENNKDHERISARLDRAEKIFAETFDQTIKQEKIPKGRIITWIEKKLETITGKLILFFLIGFILVCIWFGAWFGTKWKVFGEPPFPYKIKEHIVNGQK